MRRSLPVLVVLAALVAACGTSKSDPPAAPAAGEGVRVLASTDWGAIKVTEGRAPAGPVLDATRAIAPVETAYGGRYLASLAGEAGTGTREWVYWVNGIESPVGAAELTLRDGDEVWWDLHVWTGRTHVPAVVGSWPAPLDRALDRGVEAVTADAALLPALAAVDVQATTPASTSGARAISGASADLAQRDPAWRRALADPAAAGLTAWIAGGRVLVWSAELGKAVPVPKATAVMVALTEDGTAAGAPVVVVAGRTAADAARAAKALADNPDLPQRHAAICLDREAAIVCSGGRGLT